PDISLSAPGEPPFLKADQLRVQIDRRVFLGTIDIKTIEIVRPRLAIVRHRDGTTNLPRSQTNTSSKPTPLHVGIVSLKQLSVNIQDEAGGYRGTAGPVDLTLDTRTSGAAPETLGPAAINLVIAGSDARTARSISGIIGGSLGFDGERFSMK